MSDSKNARRTRSLIDVFREYPAISQAIGGLHHEIMRRESVFSEGERELMAALVAAQARTSAAHHSQIRSG